jgi:hypothetical protein
MSDEHSEPERGKGQSATPTAGPAESSVAADAPSQPFADPPSSRRGGATRQIAAGLAALLVVVIAGVLLSPFWAPAIAPLLPWGGKATVPRKDFAALAARVTALERRPVAPAVDLDPLRAAEKDLRHRVNALEAAVAGLRRNEGSVAAAKQALAQLSQRLDASDAQSASRAAATSGNLAKIQQELTRQANHDADLDNRVADLTRQLQRQRNVGRNGTMLLLALLQMREAVAEARPFPAEYAVFAGLARDNPQLVAAEEPLAGAARDGVASRAVLRRRLADLAAQISAASQPSAESPTSWWAAILDRLRQLVTIRRVDQAAKTGPEAAVGAAQQALSRDDLAGAIAALGRLSGANAAAARDWLDLARRRLAAKAALNRLQELLAAQLGAASAKPPPSAPAASPPPTSPQPSATPRTPT